MVEYKGEVVDTVYFGGGTPSLLKHHQLYTLFESIYENFKLSPKEITIEANPEDVNGKNLEFWKTLGINRISIGVQTFNERGLKVLGRWHTPEECIKAVEKSLSAGFNTNVDIIFAYPEQTLKDFEKDLEMILRLKPQHISVYSLQIEEKTLYHYWYKRGKLNVPEDIREFYVLRDSILEDGGYIRYEISNFAKRGYECAHNMKYWKREKYLGLGPSAASFIPEKKLRFRNLPSLNLYMKNHPPPREYEILDDYKERIEKIYLGLRIGLKKEELGDMGKVGEFLEEFEGNIRVKKEFLHIFDKIVEELI